MAARRALCISDIMVAGCPAPWQRCRSARGFARRFYVKGEAASTRLRARYGALRRAKGPNCKAANLPGPHARRKAGAPTGPAEPSRDQYTEHSRRSRREPTSPFHRKVGSPTCKAKPARRDYQQFGVRGIVRLLHGTPSQHRLDLSHAIQHKRAAKPAPASGQQPQTSPRHRDRTPLIG